LEREKISTLVFNTPICDREFVLPDMSYFLASRTKTEAVPLNKTSFLCFISSSKASKVAEQKHQSATWVLRPRQKP
jgi:hypothetical protein